MKLKLLPQYWNTAVHTFKRPFLRWVGFWVRISRNLLLNRILMKLKMKRYLQYYCKESKYYWNCLEPFPTHVFICCVRSIIIKYMIVTWHYIKMLKICLNSYAAHNGNGTTKLINWLPTTPVILSKISTINQQVVHSNIAVDSYFYWKQSCNAWIKEGTPEVLHFYRVIVEYIIQELNILSLLQFISV